MRYENDGSGTREVHARVRVQTPAGLNSGGQLVFQYNALDEQVEIRSVRVIKPDGTPSPPAPKRCRTKRPDNSRSATYTDARQKHVTVPAWPWAMSSNTTVITRNLFCRVNSGTSGISSGRNRPR